MNRHPITAFANSVSSGLDVVDFLADYTNSTRVGLVTRAAGIVGGVAALVTATELLGEPGNITIVGIGGVILCGISEMTGIAQAE